MKNITGELLDFLNSKTEFVFAELYTFQLTNGATLYYAAADINIVRGGNTYIGIGPQLKRDAIKTMVGTQVDQLNITVFGAITDTVLGMPFLAAIAQGIFDGAWITIERLFMSAWQPQPSVQVGVVNIFSGSTSDCTVGRSSGQMTIESPLELLNINMPRNMYQPSCYHSLYDTGCTLSKLAFLQSGSVTAQFGLSAFGSDINVPGAGDNYYQLGVVTFTSGQNDGISRAIAAFGSEGGIVQVNYPFPDAPALGDTFNIVPGCDHSQATCQAKFNNVINFGGFPYIPVPETST